MVSPRYRLLALAVWLSLTIPAAGCAQASGMAVSSDSPVNIPLTVTQNPRFGTYAAKITIALGGGRPLSFGFDTGSSGLHAFADAALDATGSGVRCSQTPTSVTYGNPPRITFNGVVCYATLHFEGLTTPSPVPVAYLTSASCAPANPGCRIPNLHDPKAMGGYGVFGAALTGITFGAGRVPNPILTLPGRRGSTYNVVLKRSAGTLVLGGSEPDGAAEFRLTPGNVRGERYALPQTCLFANGRAAGACMLASFDTGNGVPWIHAADIGSVPQQNGLVAAGTHLGFAPAGGSAPATSVVAGAKFADAIKVVDVPGKAALTNASIQAFFDRVVTYDAVRGTIAVAPAP